MPPPPFPEPRPQCPGPPVRKRPSQSVNSAYAPHRGLPIPGTFFRCLSTRAVVGQHLSGDPGQGRWLRSGSRAVRGEYLRVFLRVLAGSSSARLRYQGRSNEYGDSKTVQKIPRANRTQCQSQRLEISRPFYSRSRLRKPCDLSAPRLLRTRIRIISTGQGVGFCAISRRRYLSRRLAGEAQQRFGQSSSNGRRPVVRRGSMRAWSGLECTNWAPKAFRALPILWKRPKRLVGRQGLEPWTR